jgi:hypothetical protein
MLCTVCLLPGIEQWQSAVDVRQLKQAWASAWAGPHQLHIILRSVLVFERNCRLSHFASAHGGPGRVRSNTGGGPVDVTLQRSHHSHGTKPKSLMGLVSWL